MKIKKMIFTVTALLMVISFSSVSKAGDLEEIQKRYDKMEKEMQTLKKQMLDMQKKMQKKEENSSSVETQQIQQELNVLKAQVKNASGWMNQDIKLNLTGFTSVGYASKEGDHGTFNLGSFSPIFQMTYKDLLLFETELEFEIDQENDGSSETKTAIEYMTMDLFINDNMTLVIGKFLSPIGQFRQNLHPSWINKLPSAPVGFGHDQASPVSDVGIQLRGVLPMAGKKKINYALFVSNGPRLEIEEENPAGSDDWEIEAIEGSGLTSANSGNKVVGGRIGFQPSAKFELGLSGAVGSATHTIAAANGDIRSRNYNILGADFYYNPNIIKNLILRGEYVKTTLSSGRATEDDSEKKEWEAWYLQASYLVPDSKTELAIRYGQYTDGNNVKRTQFAPGINYLFSSSTVLKLAYEFNNGDTDAVSSDRLLLQFAFGF